MNVKNRSEIMVELGRAGLALALAKERRAQGLSQSQLAAKVGISQQQMSKLENGGSCHLNATLKVCVALGLELSIRKRQRAGFGNRVEGGE
jgi:HTH-type transcriptional regulator / antitoxin HipB